MAEMVASMRQQNVANSGNNSNGQSSQSTLPHGLPTTQPTNAFLPPPALNIPLQENQTQIPQPTTKTFTFPPPPPGVYPFTPSMFTTSGGIPTTQPIPPPTYAMPPPAPGHTPNNPLFVPDEQFQREIGGAESQRVLSQIEERLKAMEGTHAYGITDAYELSLVDGLVIPPKFKVPEFEKYKGTTCPKDHITMYCRKMAAYSRDDKLLIHCFQDSFTGSATRWYNKLDRRGIHSWNDLAQAFIDQYKHMTDLVPDRLTLQNMEKKSSESFTEYAQRWRDIAAKIQPPLTEKETTRLFVNTLKAPYYSHMLAGATKSFTDMVLVGEMVENALKTGELVGGESSTAKKNPKKKEGRI